MKKSLDHIPVLDGVRGVAVLMVLIFHFWQMTGEKTNLLEDLGYLEFLSIGQKGVDSFFVLSGFLITGILFKTKEEPKYFLNFYCRRALRIFPLYYLTLIICLIWGTFGNAEAFTLKHIWPYFFYLQNIVTSSHLFPIGGPGHFWSLAVEEHFYLFWPFLIFFLSRKKLIVAAYALIGLAFATRIWMDERGFPSFGFTLCRADSLVIGGLLYLFYSSKKFPLISRILVRASPIIFSLSAILFLFFSGQAVPFIQYVKYPFFACLAGVFIVLALTPCGLNPVPWIMQDPRLRYLGKISYGLYVFHPFVFSLCLDIFYPRWQASYPFSSPGLFVAVFILSLAATVLVSSLSFKYFESPFLELKRMFGGVRSEFRSNIGQ